MKRYNLIVPLNGKGERMKTAGFTTPKPLIMAGDKPILEWGLRSIDTTECQLIFIVRRDQPLLEQYIRMNYPDAILLVARQDGKGSLGDVVTVGGPHINNHKPLIVFNPDVAFSKYTPQPEHFQDGLILTFRSNSPNYSYAAVDEVGHVLRTAEKQVISNLATVGLYCFRSGAVLCECYRHSVAHDNGEHYVAPIFNQLVQQGARIHTKSVDKMYVMGTPAELQFFQRHIYPTTQRKQLLLCCDHSGFYMKEQFKQALSDKGQGYIDVGTHKFKDCDYAKYVKRAVDMKSQESVFGLAFCRSGQGIGICVNKMGPEKVCCVLNSREYIVEDATLAIEHNCANFFAISSRMELSKEDMYMLADAIQWASFDGGRHQIRMMKTLGYIECDS